MNAATDILIVGGGFTGASLACALADGKRRILVLEARTGRNPRFMGELMHPAPVDVFDKLGVLADLRRVGGIDIRGFAVCGAPGHGPIELPYSEVPGARPAGYAIEHNDMVAELRRAAAARPGVEVRYGVRVAEVVREGGRVVGVRTAEGEVFRASFTLVAEGRHSKLRGQIDSGASQRLVSYNAAVLVDDTELPCGSSGHIFVGAPGPILAYPIAHLGGNRYQVRMCLDLPTLPDERGTEAIVAVLREQYAQHVPEPLRSGMLASLETREPDVAAVHAISTERCTAPGIALVGESGGCSHPLTAAGMTICLHDVRALSEELATGLTDAALGRYQTRRYRFVRAREVLVDALYEVFLAKKEGTAALREGMFRYWESSPRARGASLGLLSGADSRLSSFLTEYWRVAGHGLGRSLGGQVPGVHRSLRGRVRATAGLVGKSVEKLGSVARHVRDGNLR